MLQVKILIYGLFVSIKVPNQFSDPVRRQGFAGRSVVVFVDELVNRQADLLDYRQRTDGPLGKFVDRLEERDCFGSRTGAQRSP